MIVTNSEVFCRIQEKLNKSDFVGWVSISLNDYPNECLRVAYASVDSKKVLLALILVLCISQIFTKFTTFAASA